MRKRHIFWIFSALLTTILAVTIFHQAFHHQKKMSTNLGRLEVMTDDEYGLPYIVDYKINIPGIVIGNLDPTKVRDATFTYVVCAAAVNNCSMYDCWTAYDDARTGDNPSYASCPNANVCVTPDIYVICDCHLDQFCSTYLGGAAPSESDWIGDYCDIILNDNVYFHRSGHYAKLIYGVKYDNTIAPDIITVYYIAPEHGLLTGFRVFGNQTPEAFMTECENSLVISL